MAPTSDKNQAKSQDVQDKINEIMVEGGQLVKMEVDYTSTCDEKLPAAEKLAKEGKLNAALEILYALEKQTRTGADMHSTSRVLVKLVQLCFEAQDWTQLNEAIITLTKKRSQIKASITKMVQECYSWIRDGRIKDKTVELKLIETLRTVTAGKIYVEVERARLTRRLADMQEADGKVEEAAKTMQELQVETYGSMEKKEKVEFILEQMRLCLATNDYIRTQIISKKISTRFFESEEHQELKLKFYKYMIQMDQHEQNYLNICRHYQAILQTPKIKENNEEKLMTLKYVSLYIILSPYDNEQSDLIHRILLDKSLEDIPQYKALLEQFTTWELINQEKLCELYEKDLRKGGPNNLPTDVFDESEQGAKRWEDLRSRVVEHNIRIMAKYYTRIKLDRMAELLALSKTDTEDFLSKMVTNKQVEARTDRLDGVVDFTRHQVPNEMLNDWSNNITELMSLVMKTTHLINKEEMVHKHMLGKEEKVEA